MGDMHVKFKLLVKWMVCRESSVLTIPYEMDAIQHIRTHLIRLSTKLCI